MTLWFPFFSKQPDLPDFPLPQPELADTDKGEKSAAQYSVPSPMALPVHILAGETVIRTQQGRIVIERSGKTAIERPLELVSALHIYGWPTITSPTVRALLNLGIAIIWRSPSGYPVGYSSPLDPAGLEVRKAQYKAADSSKNLELAKQFVTAKIINMRDFVRRKHCDSARALIRPLGKTAQKALGAKTVKELFGFEGYATAQYFAIWNDLILEQAGDVSFDGRSRRPPRDEVNALLSYAYAVLLGECLCAAVASGLDPRQGFLHVVRAGRPSLALDIMEAFRPLVADAAVLAGLNRGQFDMADFGNRKKGGFVMTGQTKKILVALIEKRLSSEVSVPGQPIAISYRQLIGRETRKLASALVHDTDFQSWRRG